MANIIDFPKSSEVQILCCSYCGAAEFYLISNGSILCMACDETYDGLAWGVAVDQEDYDPPPPLAA